MSKGSKPRPHDRDKFNENFDKIFRKGKDSDKGSHELPGDDRLRKRKSQLRPGGLVE